jgi:diguanylate cyclase (GGDEF)-like protein
MTFGPNDRGGGLDRALDWVLTRSRRLTLGASLVIGLLLLVFVAALDIAVGPEVEFSALYMLPVIAVAWAGVRSLGMLAAFIACTAWVAVQTLANPGAQPTWAVIVMLLTRFATLALVALFVTHVRHATESFAVLAELDPLTHLLNRRALFGRLGAEISRCERHPDPLTVVYFDVDDFKGVNDRSGHDSGDHLLLDLAEAMAKTLRTEDLGARVGGDEFVGVLPQTDCAGARDGAERLFRCLGAAAAPYGSSVSLGVVTFLTPPSSADAAIALADHAMYRAKSRDTGQIEFDVQQ